MFEITGERIFLLIVILIIFLVMCWYVVDWYIRKSVKREIYKMHKKRSKSNTTNHNMGEASNEMIDSYYDPMEGQSDDSNESHM